MSTRPPVERPSLTTVALACRDATELTFQYAPGERSGSAPGRRRVEPLRLVPVGRRWYLLAYDLDRVDWRTFRIDRMRDARAEATGGDSPAYAMLRLTFRRR